MSAFLSKDELITLTGYKDIPYQLSWLDNNGWIYIVNSRGKPVVGREYCNTRMAGAQIIGNRIEQLPDFSKIHNGRRKENKP